MIVGLALIAVASFAYAVYKHMTLSSVKAAVLAEVTKVEASVVPEVKALAAAIKAKL
jgi:hypothetical protein